MLLTYNRHIRNTEARICEYSETNNVSNNQILISIILIREDSFIDFVWRNVPGTFRGVGVLSLDVSVKIEIIDFLQPRIKQKLRENIITPEKCVKGIDYVQP